MTNEQRYTAQDMREMEAIIASGDVGPMTRERIARMLKQAADTEEGAGGGIKSS